MPEITSAVAALLEMTSSSQGRFLFDNTSFCDVVVYGKYSAAEILNPNNPIERFGLLEARAGGFFDFRGEKIFEVSDCDKVVQSFIVFAQPMQVVPADEIHPFLYSDQAMVLNVTAG